MVFICSCLFRSVGSLIQCYGQRSGSVVAGTHGKEGEGTIAWKTFGFIIDNASLTKLSPFFIFTPSLTVTPCLVNFGIHSLSISNSASLFLYSLLLLETVSAPCHWKNQHQVEEKDWRPRHLHPPPPRQLRQRFIFVAVMLQHPHSESTISLCYPF